MVGAARGARLPIRSASVRTGVKDVGTRTARANTLIQAFLALVRERRGDNLEAWISEAIHSVIEELARFARGVQDDLTAIMEAGSPKMTKTGGIMTRMV